MTLSACKSDVHIIYTQPKLYLNTKQVTGIKGMLLKLLSRQLLAVLCVSMATSAVYAAPSDVITKQLKQSRPDIQLKNIKSSPVKGIQEVELADGSVIYASDDGKHFFYGELFQINDSGFTNLTEARNNVTRKDALAKVSLKDLVVYKPKGETKAAVTVFTDIDCGYCRKLHMEMAKMNELGIEVRYMAFPRAGVKRGAEYTPSFTKIASAWCAKDPQAALTDAKMGKELPANICKDNPIEAQYQLGQKLGVRGTPAMILEDGSMVPGYLPADQLASRLGIN